MLFRSSELHPFASKGQTSIEGEDRTLSSRVAQALGMALHELAINAAKYGALSTANGRLGIAWQQNDDHSLTIKWQETGLNSVTTGATKGFGTTIIDRVLPLETGGHVTRTLGDTGLTCTITLPDPLRA